LGRKAQVKKKAYKGLAEDPKKLLLREVSSGSRELLGGEPEKLSFKCQCQLVKSGKGGL
jgi:hypothetical protein